MPLDGIDAACASRFKPAAYGRDVDYSDSARHNKFRSPDGIIRTARAGSVAMRYRGSMPHTPDDADPSRTGVVLSKASDHGIEDTRAEDRDRMVQSQLIPRGITNAAVLSTMRRVPRERFVPAGMRPLAHADGPLPIGYDQTISQPYIVAVMTELAAIAAGARVLEIGTGCGYQTAVLAELAGMIYSIEIIGELASSAEIRLGQLGYTNVRLRHGDGYQGWPDAAPFDAILLTAAPAEVPAPLLQQLAPGGRLVAPVGRQRQELQLIRRTKTGLIARRIFPVRFVPMTGTAQAQA